MVRFFVLMLVAVMAAGCETQTTVHVIALTDHVVVDADGEYEMDAGPHCPRMARDGDGFHFDREWSQPIPDVILFREWTGPGYEEAATLGSGRDWHYLEQTPVMASVDPGRVLFTVTWQDPQVLIDDAPVVLPWTQVFDYTADGPDGAFQVSETMTLADEGLRPLSVTTHRQLVCA